MEENNSIKKKPIFSRTSRDSPFNFDLIEFIDGTKILGIVDENKILFYSNFKKTNDFLQEMSTFQLKFVDHPESLEVFYCCAFSLHLINNLEPVVFFGFAGSTGFVYIMSLNEKSKQKIDILKGHSGSVMCMKFLKRTAYRLVTASQDNCLILWDTEKKEALFKFLDCRSFMSACNSFVI